MSFVSFANDADCAAVRERIQQGGAGFNWERRKSAHGRAVLTAGRAILIAGRAVLIAGRAILTAAAWLRPASDHA